MRAIEQENTVVYFTGRMSRIFFIRTFIVSCIIQLFNEYHQSLGSSLALWLSVGFGRQAWFEL